MERFCSLSQMVTLPMSASEALMIDFQPRAGSADNDGALADLTVSGNYQ
jgi:hypothetical protein